MIPMLSESQQIIHALLRRHGDLTVEEIAAVSGLDVERDLQELERKGCVESASGDRWRLCDTWASRIVITEEGVEPAAIDLALYRPTYLSKNKQIYVGYEWRCLGCECVCKGPLAPTTLNMMLCDGCAEIVRKEAANRVTR